MSISVTIPDELVDLVARRIIELQGEHHPAAQPDPWLTVDEAARYLACRKQRVYNLVSQGRLRHAKDGSRVLFRRQWLDDLLESS